MKKILLLPILFVFSIVSYAQELEAHGHDHTPEQLFEEQKIQEARLLEILERTKENFNNQTGPEKAINCATDNYDFENGSTSGWTVTNSAIMQSGAGNDPYGAYPRVYPGGGNFSVKLGGDQGNFQGALSRVIAVPATGQSILSFHFAISIFNFPHTSFDAARFTVRFYDQSNNLLACPNYECYYSTDLGAVGVSTFQTTPQVASFYNPAAQGAGPNVYNVTYSDWTDVTVDLSAYAGQNITVVFDNKYCLYTPDWCYAYVDVDCPSSTTQTQTVCMNLPGLLTGPTVSGTYRWYDINGNVIANTQSLNVNVPGTYTLGITPFGTSCSAAVETLYDYVVNEKPTANFTYTENCANQNLTFTNTSSTSNSTVWNFGDGTNSVNANPTHVYNTDGSKNVTLVVTDVNGCVDSITKPVNVFPTPVANFTVPNNCLNNASVFTNTSTISSGSISSWSWNFGSGTSNLQNPSFVFSGSGVQNVSLIATSVNGCKDTINQNISVFPLPNPNFSTIPVCLGSPTNFTDMSSVSAPDNINTWNWAFGNGQNSNVQNPSVVFATAGTFSNTLTITTNNGCSANVALNSVVLALPTADFSFVENCVNQNISFTNNSSTSNTTNWNFGDGNISTLNNPTHVYSNDGVMNVNLNVIDANGCSNSISKPINVFPLPLADFTVPDNCLNVASVFSDQSTVSSGNIAAWAWNFGAQTSNVQNPNFTFANDGLQNISLIVTTNNNCKDTISKTMVIYPLPIVNFSNTTVCFGNQTSFTDLSSVNAPDNINSWNWAFGNGQNSNLQNPSTNFPNDGIFSNTLTVTSNNGCIGSISKDIEVWPLPLASFTSGNVCEGNITQFTNSSTVSSNNSPNNIAGSAWLFGDGSNSNLSNPTHTYITSGVYNVGLIVSTNNGCLDTISQVTTVYDKPVASFTVAPVCEGLTSTFVDASTISNPDNIVSWNWQFGNAQNSNIQNPIVLFANEAVYSNQLIVTSNNGCKDTFVSNSTVWPLPVVNFNWGEVCLGLATDFTDLSSISNLHTSNFNEVWAWNFGDGNSANGTSVSNLYANDGVFPVTLTVTSDKNCVATKNENAIVNPNPVASFSGINLIGCSPICPEIVSTSQINAPGIIEEFEWVYSDGFIDNGSSSERCIENANSITEIYDLSLFLISDKGCKDSILVTNYITVHHLPIANFEFSPESLDIFDTHLDFENLSQFADSYYWTFGNGFTSTQLNPSITYAEEAAVYTIMLVASTDYNCHDTTYRTIEIKDQTYYFVPNAFTPDNDEFNQTFKAVFGGGYDPYNFKMEIFNRWGELIFESNDIDVGWDGTYKGEIMKEGVYTWKVTYKDKGKDKHNVIHGHLNLLR